MPKNKRKANKTTNKKESEFNLQTFMTSYVAKFNLLTNMLNDQESFKKRDEDGHLVIADTTYRLGTEICEDIIKIVVRFKQIFRGA